MNEGIQTAARVQAAAPPRSATAKEILERAGAMYRADFWSHFSVTLVACGCAVLVMYSLVSALALRAPGSGGRYVLETPLSFLLLFLSFATMAAAYGLAKGTISLITAERVCGRRPSAAGAFVALVPVMPRLVAASAVLVIVDWLSILPAMVPGLLVSVAFPLVIPAIAVERRGLKAGIGHSVRMVFLRKPPGGLNEQGNLRRAVEITCSAFTALVILTLLVVILGVVLAMLTRGFAEMIVMLSLFPCAVLFALVYPPFAIADTLLYFDIRRRYEGFDVEAAAAAGAQGRVDEASGDTGQANPA